MPLPLKSLRSTTGASGVTLAEARVGGLLPIELVERTVHVTGVPFGSGDTTIGEPAPVTVTAPHVTE